MTREEITAMFKRREAAWRAHDAATLAADHAPNAVVISPTGGVLEGREEIQRVYQIWFTAFPDLQFNEYDFLIDGDGVALLMTVTGSHAGDFFGLPASGRRVQAVCAFFYTLPTAVSSTNGVSSILPAFSIQVGVLRAKPAVGL